MSKWLACAVLACQTALSPAAAAELVMFARPGCAWCEAFDREIGPVYSKTAEGRLAPLRRVDLTQVIPADLKFIAIERVTPLFVLVDKGREVGRIRGYPGESHFWGLLAALTMRLRDIKPLSTGSAARAAMQ